MFMVFKLLPDAFIEPFEKKTAEMVYSYKTHPGDQFGVGF